MATLALILSMDFIPYSKVGSVHEIINRLINVFEFPFRFMSMDWASVKGGSKTAQICETGNRRHCITKQPSAYESI